MEFLLSFLLALPYCFFFFQPFVCGEPKDESDEDDVDCSLRFASISFFKCLKTDEAPNGSRKWIPTFKS